jgi:hypothetical protein
MSENSVGAKAHDLIPHLLKRYPAFKIRQFLLRRSEDLDQSVWSTIVECVLPRVEGLSVRFAFHGQRSDFSGLADLVDRCSGMSEKATLKAWIRTLTMKRFARHTMGRIHRTLVGHISRTLH